MYFVCILYIYVLPFLSFKIRYGFLNKNYSSSFCGIFRNKVRKWRMEYRGWMIRDGGWSLNNGGKWTEDGGRMFEDGGWRIEDGEYRTIFSGTIQSYGHTSEDG